MTTPDWQQRLTELQNIGKPAPATTEDSSVVHPPAPVKESLTVHLTSAQCDRLIGEHNPFHGPLAVWRFTPSDWPMTQRGRWAKAVQIAQERTP
jgi:hypothetical protein